MLCVLVDTTADNYIAWEGVKDEMDCYGSFIFGKTGSDFLDTAENLIRDYVCNFYPDKDPGYTFPDFIKDFAPAEYMPGILYRWEKLKSALEDAEYYGFNADTLPPLITAITGEKWECVTLRGCCQSDWAHFIYNTADYDCSSIKYIESVYFNTGAEICILDGGEEEPGSIQEFYENGCFDYVPDYTAEGIAEWLGTNPENIKLYQPKEVKTYVLEAI